MSTAAIEARRLTLARLERAAGEVFGCPQEAAPAPRSSGLTPTIVALATLATAIAATLGYLA
jgi:hypothetical protein